MAPFSGANYTALMHRWFLLASLLVSGCASSFATMEPAGTLAAGDFRVTAGMSVPVSTRFISSFADLAEQSQERLSSANTDPLNQEEADRVSENAIAVAALMPSLITTFTARYGVMDGWELGVRYASPIVGIESKHRLVDDEDWQLSLRGGYRFHTGIPGLAGKAYDLLESLKVAEFSRHDVTLALLVGTNDERIFSFYGSLGYALGFAHGRVGVDPSLVEAGVDATLFDSNFMMHYITGTAGARLHYAWFSLMAELTLGGAVTNASERSVDYDLDTFLIEPGLALSVEF